MYNKVMSNGDFHELGEALLIFILIIQIIIGTILILIINIIHAIHIKDQSHPKI